VVSAFCVLLILYGSGYSLPAQVEPALPAPTFSLPAGTYANTTLTMSDSVSGAKIYYTSNGSTPTTSSTVYTGAIALNSSGTFTFKAMAVKTGYLNSSVTTVTYTIHPYEARPKISPPGGSYATPQTVTISVTKYVAIYYTTNGSTPTTSSTLYTGPITVSKTETINAIAVASGFTNSPVVSETYTIEPALPAPTFSLPAGTYANTTLAMSDSVSGAKIYYTSNGSTPTTSSTVYTAPIALNSSGTFIFKAIAVKTGYINSPVTAVAYSIQPILAKPSFWPPAGFYALNQTVTISDVSTKAAIYYTTNGSTPTTSSTLYTGPIAVRSSETVNAIAVLSGFTDSPVASAAYNLPAINLTWYAPTNSPVSVTGYNIYRAVGSSSAFQLLNSSLDTETTYEDSTVQGGTSYTYYVESVDASGVKSIPSSEVAVTVP
jgi:hypothetical protein